MSLVKYKRSHSLNGNHNDTREPLKVSDLTIHKFRDLAPMSKCPYHDKWECYPTGDHGIFNLGKMSLMKTLQAYATNTGYLIHPEIHVVWRSLCPPRVATDQVRINFEFTAMMDETACVLQTHTHPIFAHVHHIFYPEHAIKIGVGELIPWGISYELDTPLFTDTYKFAHVSIHLKGYKADTLVYTERHSSELISLMPVDEVFQGTTLSLPRVSTNGIEYGRVKMGLTSKSDLLKLQWIVESGVDIEGLQLVRKLGALIHIIGRSKVDSSNQPRLHQYIRAQAAILLKK